MGKLRCVSRSEQRAKTAENREREREIEKEREREELGDAINGSRIMQAEKERQRYGSVC